MREPVLWLALLIIVGAWVLFLLGVVVIWIALIATIGGGLLLGWNLDRTGRGARALRHVDQNRPDFYGESGAGSWAVPTAYIDHRSGTGPPPGVEPYDEERVARDIGERGVSSGPSRDSDEAP
jgi:hypothetical protein